MTDLLTFTITAETHPQEWERMWTTIQALCGDRLCVDAKTGASWQYLCTQQIADGYWYHCFRHAHYPKTQRREQLFIPFKPSALQLESVHLEV